MRPTSAKFAAWETEMNEAQATLTAAFERFVTRPSKKTASAVKVAQDHLNDVVNRAGK